MERTKEIRDYDNEEVFLKEIKPHLDEISKICSIHKMPFFYSIATKNMKGKTEYEEGGIRTGSSNINLYQNYFTTFLLVRHLNLVPASNLTEFNEESLGEEGMDYLQNSFFEDMGDLEFDEE